MQLTISQAAERTGLTAHTLRYYDREGLLPFVSRTSSGARSFGEEDLRWLQLITCLKQTGMPIKQIRQYIDWYVEGDGTKENRLQLLINHKESVIAQIAELQDFLEVINHKIAFYESTEKERELVGKR